MVLDNLISEVKDRYWERYRSLFDSKDVASILEERLNPLVRDVCETGNFTLDG
jgi:hypothetical protein